MTDLFLVVENVGDVCAGQRASEGDALEAVELDDVAAVGPGGEEEPAARHGQDAVVRGGVEGLQDGRHGVGGQLERKC